PLPTGGGREHGRTRYQCDRHPSPRRRGEGARPDALRRRGALPPPLAGEGWGGGKPPDPCIPAIRRHPWRRHLRSADEPPAPVPPRRGGGGGGRAGPGRGGGPPPPPGGGGGGGGGPSRQTLASPRSAATLGECTCAPPTNPGIRSPSGPPTSGAWPMRSGAA